MNSLNYFERLKEQSIVTLAKVEPVISLMGDCVRNLIVYNDKLNEVTENPKTLLSTFERIFNPNKRELMKERQSALQNDLMERVRVAKETILTNLDFLDELFVTMQSNIETINENRDLIEQSKTLPRNAYNNSLRLLLDREPRHLIESMVNKANLYNLDFYSTMVIMRYREWNLFYNYYFLINSETKNHGRN
jgi:hypothetical protein